MQATGSQPQGFRNEALSENDILMRRSTKFRALFGGSQRQVGSTLRSRRSFRKSQKEAVDHTIPQQNENTHNVSVCFHFYGIS
jgi:hypothetical protein